MITIFLGLLLGAGGVIEGVAEGVVWGVSDLGGSV